MFIFSCTKERKEEVPFSMAIGNRELMPKCFPKHSRIGTVRMKEDKETAEEVKKRGASMEGRKRARIKEVPTAYHNLIKIQY